VDQSSYNFFVERGKERCHAPGFQILDISILSGNIRAQIGKGSKTGPNSAFFWPQIFLGIRPPNFWKGFHKLNMLPNMWQNFVEVGPRTSEISR